MNIAIIKITDLKWITFCTKSGNCEAKTPFGDYILQKEALGWELWLAGNDGDADSYHPSKVDAMAAAEEDFFRRVRLCLEVVSP